MAMDAKMNFLTQVEHRSGSVLTKDALDQALRIISDVLEGFDMRERAAWDEDPKDDLLDIFLNTMSTQGRSGKTIWRYKQLLQRFLKEVGVKTRRINVYHIRNWLAKEKDRGIMDSTMEGERQVLSSYFGWLFRESLIEKNPMTNVGPIKVAKRAKTIISDIEMEKLKQACDKMHGIQPYRNRAILLFLASTGCRVSEMIGLDRDSVDLKNFECIVHGKGNKDRTVFLDPVTGMAIQQYFAKRKDSGEALFVGKEGKRLTPGGVREMLLTVSKIAGVENRIHPHKFRRTLATEMTRRGMPIQEVASILGHEKLDTTMEYVMLDHETVKANYRKFA